MWTGTRTSLSARLPPRPLTRFAPSPTGYLHLGHVANAVCVWGISRALGGRVLLRLEDHDRGRCRPEYEQAVLDDLEWLGLEADAGSPCRQSDRESVYLAELEHLASSGQVYACDCSRKEMALDGGDAPDIETRYSGRCRHRGLAAGDGRGTRAAPRSGR